jgi:Flp pilus assembly protein TadG
MTRDRGAAGRRGRSRRRDDEGSLALYMAVMAVGLLAMAGLVIDGGAAIAARGRAADIAAEAARAGADSLTQASLRGPSPSSLQIDPAAAHAAANRVLSLRGATGEISIAEREVTVIAHVPQQAAVLSAVGVTDLTGTAQATATILHGRTTGAP